MSLQTVRRRAKLYRALKGDSSPYSSDFVDLDVGNLHFPVSLTNAIGCGAVPQSFYGKSPADSIMDIYQKLFTLYDKEKVSKAEFVNLYDMNFDKPETHVFKKKQKDKTVYYFSFFADDTVWNGEVEFRGLDRSKKYKVLDYINNKELGELDGKSPKMNIQFEKNLLVKCIEK
jgi:alpha-galactosidase